MPDAAMEFLELLLSLVEVVVDGFCYVRSKENSLRFCIWEWIGFLGASAWLIFSLGRVKWENNDWRAVLSGSAILLGSLTLIVWFRLNHCTATTVS